MNTRSYFAIFIIAALLFYFIWPHSMDSQIIKSQDSLSFYLTDSYCVFDSDLVFRYNPEDKPLDKQLQKMHDNCKNYQGLKLTLVKTVDNHIFGGLNTDLCWHERKPKSELMPFIFSLNTTERILFLPDKKFKAEGDTKGFLFGTSVFIREKQDHSGIEFCFHDGTFQMGRAMTWMSSGPGKCVEIDKIQIFNIELSERLNIQGRFEEFMEDQDYQGAEDL